MGNSYMHEIMDCLVEALEAKDYYTRGHSKRVADMSCDLAIELEVSGETYETVHLAAHLHHIGKMGIPDYILHKKERLTEMEWNIIKEHPKIGYNILSKSNNLQKIAKVVLHHHERYGGRGYPDGLKGNEIPYESRIIAVCDSIDAMTSIRPYRDAMPWEVCIDEVRKNSGIQFEPEIVEAVNGLWRFWKNSGNSIITKNSFLDVV